MNTLSNELVVIGFDGSGASGAAVDWAARAAECHALPLQVVSVVDHPGAWSGFTLPDNPVPVDLLSQAEHLVETAAHRAEKASPAARVTTKVVHGSPAAVLRTMSESASLLVLGNRRHNELGALSARSVTFALAAHAHGPLVLVPEVGRGVARASSWASTSRRPPGGLPTAPPTRRRPSAPGSRS
jgi:nucleotide-binding universal stress UspA family protein